MVHLIGQKKYWIGPHWLVIGYTNSLKTSRNCYFCARLVDSWDQGKNVLGGEAMVFPPLGFPSTAAFRHFRSSYYSIFTSDRESAKDQKNTRSLFIKKKQQKQKKKHANEESENGGVEAYTFI